MRTAAENSAAERIDLDNARVKAGDDSIEQLEERSLKRQEDAAGQRHRIIR